MIVALSATVTAKLALTRELHGRLFREVIEMIAWLQNMAKLCPRPFVTGEWCVLGRVILKMRELRTYFPQPSDNPEEVMEAYRSFFATNPFDFPSDTVLFIRWRNLVDLEKEEIYLYVCCLYTDGVETEKTAELQSSFYKADLETVHEILDAEEAIEVSDLVAWTVGVDPTSTSALQRPA